MKKVKFSTDNSLIEEFVVESESESELINDLDLDTVKSKSSRARSKGLKEFDSEESEPEPLEDEADPYKDLMDPTPAQLSEIESQEEFSDEVDDREIQFEPFSLRNDREEGTFDDEGFYVRTRDEEADQDHWMANFTRSDILKAKKAHEEREKNSLAAVSKSKTDEKSLYEELAGLMSENNDLTVLQVIRSIKQEALISKPRAPLNKNRLKKLQQQQQQQQQSDREINTSGHSPSKIEVELSAEGRNNKLERITELADALMDFGNFGVYEETRREILHKLNLNKGV